MGWCVSILAREFGKRGITWRFHLENGVWHGQFSETFLCRIQLLTVNQNWKFQPKKNCWSKPRTSQHGKKISAVFMIHFRKKYENMMQFRFSKIAKT
jgi:hypothetical protein